MKPFIGSSIGSVIFLLGVILQTASASTKISYEQASGLVAAPYEDIRNLIANPKIRKLPGSKYNNSDPRINYVIHLVKALGENDSLGSNQEPINQEELNEILVWVSAYRFSSQALLKVILAIKNKELKYKPSGTMPSKMAVEDTSRALGMILNVRSKMDQHFQVGIKECWFLPGTDLTDVLTRHGAHSSPFVKEEAISRDIEQEYREAYNMQLDERFVVAQCGGGTSRLLFAN